MSTSSDSNLPVREALEAAKQQFAALIERSSPDQRLLAAVFQQLETCLTAGQRLEERQWRHLRTAVAARWQQQSVAACRPRQQQLKRRRQLLSEQQLILDALLLKSREQLKHLAKPPSDLMGRLQRKWEKMCSFPGEAPVPTAEGTAEDQKSSPGPVVQSPTHLHLKPWKIEGLSLQEICDAGRLRERERQVDEQVRRLEEMRDADYRPIGDYIHCLRRFLKCTEQIDHDTNILMKVRAEVRLHAGWVRDRQKLPQPRPPPLAKSATDTATTGADTATASSAAAVDTAGDCEPTADLQYYDRAAAGGLLEPAICRVGDASQQAAPAEPPLREKLLYAQLDADESRRLVAEAAERGSWYEVEFALAHGRLTLTSECVVAMFVQCHCRGGRCQCNWTRLALAAQRQTPDKPARTRGWGWRKMRMAVKLIQLLHTTQAEGPEE